MVTLRWKMLLWLLPVVLSIFLFAYGYYNARERIIVGQIRQTVLLASSLGEQDFNHFLQLRNSEFNLLNQSINSCSEIPRSNASLAISALRYTTGFSALVMSDEFGKVVHAELSSNRSNRHVLTKDILTQSLLSPSAFFQLKQGYLKWFDELKDLKLKEISALRRLNLLKDRGEINSREYRSLQQQLFDLREHIGSPPTFISFAGGNAAEAIGLPFTEDTFLFSKPILDCGGGLKGFYTAYLDRTLLENRLYDIKHRVVNTGVEKVDVALVANNHKNLITKARFISQDNGLSLKVNDTPRLNHTLGGMYALKIIKESVDMTAFSDPQEASALWANSAVSKPVNQQGISLLVFVSLDEIKKRCTAVKYEVITESLVLLSVFLILIWLLSRHIVSPIVSLTHRAKRLAVGEHIPKRLAARSDEIGGLSHTFEEMAKAIKEKEQQLIELATHDPLTGSLNRRALFSAVEEEKARAIRGSVPIIVCMLDLDHFKRINDLFGHKEGDNVLCQFVTSVKSILRTEDKIGRVGGEEFVVVLAGVSLIGGMDISERIREKVSKISVGRESDSSLRVTVSIGVSEWNLDEPFELALSRADELLYKAKKSGRNRVEG